MIALGAGYGCTCINITTVREFVPPELAASVIGLVNFVGDMLILTGFGGLTDNEFRTLITSGSEATFNGFESLDFEMDGKSVYDQSYDSMLNKWTFSCSGLNYSLALETNGDSSTSMILTRLA